MTAKAIEKTNGSNRPIENREATVVRKFTPAVDIFERPDELVIVADVPGATADGVNIQFERGRLSVEAAVRPRREEGRTNYLAREYCVGCYQRSFEVNEQIDADKITAKIENGVLTITLPKAEAVRPRKITVKGA